MDTRTAVIGGVYCALSEKTWKKMRCLNSRAKTCITDNIQHAEMKNKIYIMITRFA